MKKLIKKLKKLKKIKPFKKRPRDSSNKIWKKLSLELTKRIYKKEYENT